MANDILHTIYVVIGPSEEILYAHATREEANYWANERALNGEHGKYVVRSFILPASEYPAYINRQTQQDDRCVCANDCLSGVNCPIHGDATKLDDRCECEGKAGAINDLCPIHAFENDHNE